MGKTGKIIGIGVGPGDPELISVKALKALKAADCVAFHQAPGRKSHALAIAEAYLASEQTLIPLTYPLTTEKNAHSAAYAEALKEFYRQSEAKLRAVLNEGNILAVLAEGDPLFYSSFMYIYDLLAKDYPAKIIPGITSVSAATSAMAQPLCYRDEIVEILPATLPETVLESHLRETEGKAFVFMKLGQNFKKIRELLAQAKLASRAFYIEYASEPRRLVLPLEKMETDAAPYFSMIIVPGQKENGTMPPERNPPKHGRVSLIGLGPGGAETRSLSAERALRQADFILGYKFYIEQGAPYAANQTLIPSDNREEIARCRHALELARQGRDVALLSSGDAGVYGMASAFFEAYENEEISADNAASEIDINVEAGISAAFATAAKLGAPLGHDFALISLSDNLKPWAIIEKRLRAAAESDMVIAIYNPVSKIRQKRLIEAVALLRSLLAPERLVGLGTDIERKGEALSITTLAELDFNEVTSRTIMIIGSSKTRCFTKGGRKWLYTPRHYK